MYTPHLEKVGISSTKSADRRGARPLTGLRLSAAAAVAGLLVAGCSMQEGASQSAATAVQEAPSSGTEEAVSISGAWARSLPNGMGAVYAEIVVDSDDRLLSAAVIPAQIAGKVEVHEVKADASGAMSMSEVEGGIPIVAGVPLELRPGGYHIMLMGMPEILDPGAEFVVEVVFENAGRRQFTATVADADAGSGGMNMGSDG